MAQHATQRVVCRWVNDLALRSGSIEWLPRSRLANALKTLHRLWDHDDLFDQHELVQKANESATRDIAGRVKGTHQVQSILKIVHGPVQHVPIGHAVVYAGTNDP